MAGSLGSLARSTGRAVIFDKSADVGPDIFATNESKGPIDSEVTGEWVIVLVLEYAESEIVDIRNVHPAIKSEETLVVDGPAGSGRIREVLGSEWIRRKGCEDISMKLFKVHGNGSTENRSDKGGCTE